MVILEEASGKGGKKMRPRDFPGGAFGASEDDSPAAAAALGVRRPLSAPVALFCQRSLQHCTEGTATKRAMVAALTLVFSTNNAAAATWEFEDLPCPLSWIPSSPSEASSSEQDRPCR